MRRHWRSFDYDVTNREFDALTWEDRSDLFEAMKLYRLDVPVGYVIKNYGDGLLMIKPKDGQGRCLFFTEVEFEGTLELVALLVYKKESRKLPERLRKLALQRMRAYEEKQK